MPIIKNLIKKIPFMIPLYKSIKNDLPYLFYNKPKVLIIQGSKMYLNVHERDKSIQKTFRAYAKNQIHEPTTTKFIRNILKEGDTFIDLGANIGYFSLLAANKVGKKGKVFSFEPEPRNFKYLMKNKELNEYNQITATQKALSNKKDVIKLYICPYDTGHHTIKQSEGITSYETSAVYEQDKICSIEIETIILDEFLSSQGIKKVDLIKMDVEGAELLALEGMEKTISKNDDIKMIVEFFPLLIEKMGCSPGAFLKKLSDEYKLLLYEVVDDYNAEHSLRATFLKKIDKYEELLSHYANDKMYHINIFAIKNSNKYLEQILSYK